MKKTSQMGLTLIELLVGMALMALILTVLTSFFVQSSRTSVQSAARADLQQEALNAQQLITGRLKEAFYVFPTSTVFNLGSGNLRKNPSISPSTTIWTVGTSQPILAMILPPKVPTGTCSTSSTTTVTETDSGGFTEPAPSALANSSDGCYRFFAYYAVKRSQWERNTTGANDPGADDSNEDTWVLVEYRDTYYGPTLPATIPTSMPDISTTNRSKAYLLMDYLAPTQVTSSASLSTAKPATTRSYTMFSLTPTTGAVQKITINLASARYLNGRLMRLPAADSEYTISVFPTNLGKIAAN